MKKLFVPTYNVSTGFPESWEVVQGSLRSIYRQLCKRLDVSGPRWLSAYDSESDAQPATITASLYDGESKIVAADGRVIYRS